MSLPACQQRALDRMDSALRASEPHLAAMYATFGRLNAGEPVGAEEGTTSRVRDVRQTIHDPEGHHDWVIEAVVDCDATDAAGELVLAASAMRRL